MWTGAAQCPCSRMFEERGEPGEIAMAGERSSKSDQDAKRFSASRSDCVLRRFPEHKGIWRSLRVPGLYRHHGNAGLVAVR